jgi:hypothetical protein
VGRGARAAQTHAGPARVRAACRFFSFAWLRLAYSFRNLAASGPSSLTCSHLVALFAGVAGC